MASQFGLTGVAGADLGLGDMLGQQQRDETEEQRKKRLLGLSPLTGMAGADLGLGFRGMGGLGGFGAR